MRLYRVVIAAVVIIPALLFAAAAWQNHADVLREGHSAIQRTAAVMQEHARKVFETAELAIGQVDERTSALSQEEIAEPVVSDFLRRLKAPMDQIVSIWISGPDGVVLAGSQPWDAGLSIADRRFFQALKHDDGGTYVGVPFVGRVTNLVSFAIARRRITPDGQFDGTIHVSASPDYFRRFYAETSPRISHVAMLLREDGTVLVREPADDAAPPQLDADARLMRRIATMRAAGARASDMVDDGMGGDFAIRQVGSYPVYVAFAVPHDVLLKPWHENLLIYGAVAAAATLTLLLVSWSALRRAAAEEAALIRLRAETEQRQVAEDQLRHAQRMDAVGQLTGGVAHDFNNLLTAILGNLELIQRASALPPGREAETRDKIARLTATAIKAVQRGSSLTKGLLAFSRKQPLQPRPIDVNAQLHDVLDLVRQAVGVTVEVSFEPQPGLPRCVADLAELQGAVLNLAINARDAMPGGGRLRIGTRAATLTAASLIGNPEAEPGRFVAVEVADTGVGMPAEVKAKAFEPFFTTKPIGQGTGLGLSQVFGFARQSGGHVTIDSDMGHGAAITLFLPAVSATATAAAAPGG